MSASKIRSFLGTVVGLAFGIAVALAVGEMFARLFEPHWRDYYNGRFMAELHMPGRPGLTIGIAGFSGHFAQNEGDFRHSVRINAAGLREDEDVTAADGRVWAVGDSFTFGWGVEKELRYSDRLSVHAGMPTYNIASPGTDVCGYQTLLSRMPASVRPVALVVGLVIENDVTAYDCRPPEAVSSPTSSPSLGAVKMALTAHSGLYNVFATRLKQVPGLHDLLVKAGLVAQPHKPGTRRSPEQQQEAAIRTASELAVLQAALPVGTKMAVLIIPSRLELLNGDEADTTLRLLTIGEIKRRGLAVVDPTQALIDAGFANIHFRHDGHWTPAAHDIAAGRLAEWLKAELKDSRP